MRRLLLLLIPYLLLEASVPACRGQNITRILAQHPEFSTFNHYLTATHLAGEINRRQTLTILALDNAAMAPLLAKGLTLYTLKNVLSLHVLVDYFGAKKLHQLTGGTALVSTLFQATGAAPGTAGFVNISDHLAGKVSFVSSTADSSSSSSSPADSSSSSSPADFVKSVKEIPYNLSVLQISAPLTSAAAEAPTPAPSEVNLTSLMAGKGCKTFAGLLTSTGDAAAEFEGNVGSGLTVFCPVDQAMAAFAPKFKNLSADGKLSLLLYHAIPVYDSIQMLKSGNGVVNTLATDGATRNYNLTVQNDGEVVTLRTRVTTAKITGTLIDEEPLAVYTIDQVLEPRELFKVAEAPAPAPAPAKEADAPKAAGRSRKRAASPPAPAGPDGQPADQKAADESGAGGKRARWIAVAAAAAAVMAVA